MFIIRKLSYSLCETNRKERRPNNFVSYIVFILYVVKYVCIRLQFEFRDTFGDFAISSPNLISAILRKSPESALLPPFSNKIDSNSRFQIGVH